MSGVFTAVYVLTMTCGGIGCGPVAGISQRIDLPSQQVCLRLRDAVMSRNDAMTSVMADCHGEAREVQPSAPRVQLR